jgi:hypothetical protein
MIHCYRTWICNDKDIFQHSILSLRWPQHLFRNEDIDHVAICDFDFMDALADDLFLGFNPLIVHGAVPIQSSSICVLRFRHRLSVCFCFYIHGSCCGTKPFLLSNDSEFLRCMSRGNSRSHTNSWIGYCRLSHTMITGYKKKKLGHPSEKLSGDVPRASW